MGWTIIDAHGNAWHEGSRAVNGSTEGTFDEFLERSLGDGCIYIETRSRTLIVAFSPHLVTRPTIISAFFAIGRLLPARVELLCCEINGLRGETVFPPGAVFERIEQIVAEAMTNVPRGLVSARLRLDAIDHVGRGRLSPVFEAWAQCGGQWSDELYARLRQQNLLERTVIARNPRRSDELLIQHWGAKRDLFGPTWIRRAPGSNVEAQPYPGLAGWVAACMRDALSTRDARLETVQAQILTAAGRVRRRHYDRLLLPWRAANGDSFITSVNVPRKPR